MKIPRLTTIAVTETTKERLENIGTKSQTYDKLIQELIDIAEKSAFFERQKTILNTERFVKLDNL